MSRDAVENADDNRGVPLEWWSGLGACPDGTDWGREVGPLDVSIPLRRCHEIRFLDVEIPIACSLSLTDAGAQLATWQSVMDRFIDRRIRTRPNRAELRLNGAPGGVEAVVTLAQVEKGCCPFFDFSLAIDEEGLTLVVEVPETEWGILDGFGPVTDDR